MATGVRDRAWCVVVPHHARGATLARHRLTADLDGTVASDVLSDAGMVVSELVGNAVRHAEPLPGGVVRVAWSVGDGSLEVRVTDGGSVEQPRICVVGPESVDGRGMVIVAALTARWGVIRDGLGQCVWAELRYANAS